MPRTIPAIRAYFMTCSELLGLRLTRCSEKMSLMVRPPKQSICCILAWDFAGGQCCCYAHVRIFIGKLLPFPAKRKIHMHFAFPRVAAHTLGHINRNIFRFSVGLRMFPVGIFVHVALVPAWGGWGLSSQGGEYRSGSKNADYFRKLTQSPLKQ